MKLLLSVLAVAVLATTAYAAGEVAASAEILCVPAALEHAVWSPIA